MLSHIVDEDKSSIIIGDNSLALIVIALPSSFVKTLELRISGLKRLNFRDPCQVTTTYFDRKICGQEGGQSGVLEGANSP